MYLVQILLPIADGATESPFADKLGRLREDLIQRFGGATIYSSAPAEGLWKDRTGQPVRDRIVLVEIMTDELDRAWWRGLQHRLESEFEQDEVVIRALECARL